jgi:hypothetical protein
MELAKSTEAFEQRWNDGISPATNWDQAGVGSQTVDQDLARSWELKAGLQWVRDDASTLDRFRWLLWDRYSLGRPPSRVEKRASSDRSQGVTNDGALGLPTLRVVTPEGRSSRPIGSTNEPARLGVINHS